MKISKSELLHIANLASLKLKDEEIDNYLKNLEEILDFAEIVNDVPIEGIEETVGINEKYNVFRKDEVKVFEDRAALLENAPEQERGMLKIPKVM